MLPATDYCPFKAEGVFELPLPEDPKVAAGAGTVSPDGSIVKTGNGATVGEDGTRYCSHDALFFASPDSEYIIEQQRNQLLGAATPEQTTEGAAPAED